MEIKTGSVLKTLISERRLTLKEISLGSGVPTSTIAEWSNRRVPKNPAQVRKVAKFLGVTTHFLLFGEEDSQEILQKFIKEDIFSGTFEINIKKIRREK